MAKVLPVLVIVCLVATAILALYAFFPKNSRPEEVLSVKDPKRVLLIADSNTAVAASGSLLDASENDYALPKLYAAPTDQNIKYAAALAGELAASDFQVASIRILDNQTIGIYNIQGTVAIFSLKKDAQSQLNSLQQVLAKSRIDATKIQKIDLRFDKPVVAFN